VGKADQKSNPLAARTEQCAEPADTRRPPYFGEHEPAVYFGEAALKGESSVRSLAKRFRLVEVIDDIKLPRGRPREYDHDAIIAAAEEVAKRGLEDRQSWFIEKVRELLWERHVKVPDDSTMKRIAGPVYKRAK